VDNVPAVQVLQSHQDLPTTNFRHMHSSSSWGNKKATTMSIHFKFLQ
jgi:hypothetical protein